MFCFVVAFFLNSFLSFLLQIPGGGLVIQDTIDINWCLHWIEPLIYPSVPLSLSLHESPDNYKNHCIDDNSKQIWVLLIHCRQNPIKSMDCVYPELRKSRDMKAWVLWSPPKNMKGHGFQIRIYLCVLCLDNGENLLSLEVYLPLFFCPFFMVNLIVINIALIWSGFILSYYFCGIKNNVFIIRKQKKK